MNFFSLFLTIFLFLSYLSISSSYSIDLASGETQCFFLKANVGDPITGSYEVIHSDPRPIHVQIFGPDNYLHYEKKYIENNENNESNFEDLSEGYFSFDTELKGNYKLCISNSVDSIIKDKGSRLVAFNFRIIKIDKKDYEEIGLQSELVDLKEGLDLLKDHQSYMNQREDVHKNILESINTKVFLWTILEAAILITLAFWQISYIRSFFEIKRKF